MRARILAPFLALAVVAAGTAAAAAPPAARGRAPRHPAADHPHPADLPPGAEQPPTRRLRRMLERLDPAARGLTSSDAPQTAPVAGSFHVPVLLVDFPDQPAEASLHRPEDYASMLFDVGYPLGAGSLADYYLDQSGGRLQISGDVTSSWLRLPRSYGTYTGAKFGYQTTEPNDWTLVKDAVDAADPGIDFCRSDRDRNGLVDTMFVVHAGPGAEEAGSGLWSLRWSLPNPYATDDVCPDGRRMAVKQFTVEPEEYVRTSFTPPGAPERLISVGVFVHEFGHALGLPDLYDTDYSSPGGVGPWDVMATGTYGFDGRSPWQPVPLSAWSKVALGWATPQTVTLDTTGIQLPSVDGTSDPPAILKVVPAGPAGNEYFLVENRTREGWAAGFPGPGVAVWHVDSSATDNDDDAKRAVEMVQGDGYDELGHTGSSSARGDGGDLLPGSAGVRGIDQTTEPNTDFSDGRDSHVAIWSIGDPGAVTSLDVYLLPTSPRPPLYAEPIDDEPTAPRDSALNKTIADITAVSDWPDPFTPNGDGHNDKTNIRFWVTTDDSPVTVVLRRDGRRIRRLLDKETGSAGYRTVVWNGTNRRGGTARRGTYTYRITTTDGAGSVTAVAKGTVTLRR